MKPTTRSRNLKLAAVCAFALTAGLATLARSQDPASNFLPLASNRPVNDDQPTTEPTSAHPTATPHPTAEPHPTADPGATHEPFPACEFLWPPAPYPLDSVVMKLERSPCFGACPEYSVEVHGDGTVIYEGRRFVRVVGRQEAHIERSRVEDLLDAFYDVHFFAMEPEYREHRYPCVTADGVVEECAEFVTDLPSQDVTFESPGYVKHVLDYWHPPAELRELEASIDEVAGTDRWVPMATPTP